MVEARLQEIQALLPQAMLPDWVRLGSRLVRLLRDRHHQGLHDAVLDRLLAQARASVALRERRRLQAPAVSYPPALPITARKDDIVAAIRTCQAVVIAGETGSGKTTQIPKMCLEAGLGIEARIGCTQPRRIAALSISRRIAEELNVAWGREVGCKIRFDERSSPETYIKLMTDGILLAETQGDPLLSEYNALIIDEAHERSLNIDFLLGYLKGLLARRAELKLIITSATIDTAAFSQAFDNAPVIGVSGRLYPVEVIYAPFSGAHSDTEGGAPALAGLNANHAATRHRNAGAPKPAKAGAPFRGESATEESEELTYIDAAVRAAGQVLCEPGNGDVLIFMPGERDIRETTDMLKTQFGEAAEVIPLYGRLSAGDQQRVFAPASRRKIIVATNIAETSLTIPGIRYVIDAGLARISRYNPRTRTKRLPIEPISQSSANQRKGRSGRLQNGVCIRLYSEAEFEARPPYTQPEIQRANLAEVILRMMAFRLGEIETFPFLNPPSPAAIQGGYRLLHELGALDDARQLTPLGRDLARLPIDPTLGRMLLQSQREHATRELLIIAAGLSIQDPREWPLEQKDAASTAHRRFADPRSDFLTLLNIWNAVHEQWESLRTQNQRRKFCKVSFLSYLRMREWQDLHAQLHEALEDLGTLRLNESNAAYEAIHRSILAGLLGHVATRSGRNHYQAAGNREVMLFPGSALFARTEKPKKGRGAHPKSPPQEDDASQPEWIVAGEIVETSQLFARTVAGIDPLWVVELAPHLYKRTHHDPRWSAADGRVLAEEKLTLYGLEVHQRRVAYGGIDPKEATEIFIRSALVEENLFLESERRAQALREPAGPTAQSKSSALRPDAPYRFLAHNGQVRQKIETWQTRVRRHDLGDLDQALFDFYARRIQNVSSIHELNGLLRDQTDPDFLCAAETDLVGDRQLSYDAEAFPDAVLLGGESVPLSYAYAPGEEEDGVTLKLGFHTAESVSPASVEWAVPGLREAQVAQLLRALPKTIRRQLMPFPPKMAEILRDLKPGGQSLKSDLARFIHQRYGIEIPPSAWPTDAVPPHLRPRIEILGDGRKLLGAGRDLTQLRDHLAKVKIEPLGQDPAWKRLEQRWERFGLTQWTFGDLPERIAVNEAGAPPVYAWPGLQVEDSQVNLRLFRGQESARRAGLGGVQRLVELALQKDLAWLQKDLRALSRFEPLIRGLCSVEELQADAFENLRLYLLPGEPWPAFTRARFDGAVAEASRRLPGLAMQLADRLEAIFKLREEILRRCGPPVARPAMQAKSAASPTSKSANAPQASRLRDLRQLSNAPAAAVPRPSLLAPELDAVLPKGFLRTIPFARLPHLPRYLKALLTRAERAALNPVKDQERARRLAPYQEALRRLEASPPTSDTARRLIAEFRWLIEEYKVSLFAQELGTAIPVSPRRLDEHLARIQEALKTPLEF